MTSFPLVPLRFLSALPITNGLGEAAADGDESWPRYIRTTDISGLDRLDPAKRVTLPPHVAAAAPVLRDDILMTAAGSLGTAYHHASDEPACYAGYLVRWRIDPEKASPRFMAYWTQSKHHLDQIAVGAVRSTIDNFSASKFRAMQAPAPPLDQQRAIADFLDQETAQIDAMVDAQERLVALLEERRTAAVQRAATIGIRGEELFESGYPELGRVPRDWTPTRVKRIASAVAGGTPDTEDRTLWAEEGEVGTPWVAIGDMSRRARVTNTAKSVTADGVASKRLTIGQPGTVLFAMYASVGEVSVLDVPACWNQALLGLLPRAGAVTSKFLYYALQTVRDRLPTLYRSNTQHNINAEQVGNLLLAVPPVSVQDEITAYLDDVTARTDAMIAKARESIALMKERRAAVISAAVTGRIDVRTGIEQVERDLEEARV